MADVVRTLENVLAEADVLLRLRLKEIGLEVPHMVVAVTPDGEVVLRAAGKDDHQAQAYRQSRAHEALEPILTDAMRWSSTTREELAHFLNASPALAYWLERWKATPAEAA